MSKKDSPWQEPPAKDPEVIALPDQSGKAWTLEEIQKAVYSTDVGEITATATLLHNVLHGHHPGWQGALLADLLSHWLVGHHPGDRERLLALHVEEVRALVPLTEQILFNGGRHPGWEDLKDE